VARFPHRITADGKPVTLFAVWFVIAFLATVAGVVIWSQP
jgi:hypothetical protein